MKEQPLDPLRLVLVRVDSTILDCWEVYNMLLACAQAPNVTAYGAELITALYGKQAESVCELLHPVVYPKTMCFFFLIINVVQKNFETTTLT